MTNEKLVAELKREAAERRAQVTPEGLREDWAKQLATAPAGKPYETTKRIGLECGQDSLRYAAEFDALAKAIEGGADAVAIFQALQNDPRMVADEALKLAGDLFSHLHLGDCQEVLRDELNEVRGAFYREQRRRQTNASRAANTEARKANALPNNTFVAGDACQVHAFGHWYAGRVVRVSKVGKVEVEYTSGTGVTRTKLVGSDKVRKAT